MNFYKIIFTLILVYLLFKSIKESFGESFSIPKVKVHQIKSQQNIKNKEFDSKKTLNTGKGRHDRIRYEGKWN